MARYFTDYSEIPRGTPPAGWAERWVLGGQSLEVVADPEATGGVVLRHTITENNRRAIRWDAIPPASQVEVVTRVRASDAQARFGVVARGADHGHDRDCQDGFTTELESGRHTAEQRPPERADEAQHVSRSYDHRQTKSPGRPHGTGKQDGVTPFPWAPNVFYWLRLRVETGLAGVDVRAKAWSGAGADEPPEWTHTALGSEPSEIGADGWVGLTGQVAAGARDYDVFGVGTDGDTAPTAAITS